MPPFPSSAFLMSMVVILDTHAAMVGIGVPVDVLVLIPVGVQPATVVHVSLPVIPPTRVQVAQLLVQISVSIAIVAAAVLPGIESYA